jgi:acetyl esterase/lipase
MRIKIGGILKPIMMSFANSEIGFRWDRFIVDGVLRYMAPLTDRVKADLIQVRLTQCSATLIHPRQPKANRVILFNHGGAFCFSMRNFYIRTAHRLAERTGAQVLVPDYRLAPEHPFPAALNDCRDAVEWLIRHGSNLHDIVVVGDSAGGNLALNLAQDLGRFRALILLSPWIDLSFSSVSWGAAVSGDQFVYPSSARRAAWLYVQGADWTFGANNSERWNEFSREVLKPRVSPVFGTVDFGIHTRVLLQVSGSERLLGDSLMLWQKVSGRSVDFRSDLSSGQVKTLSSGTHRMSVWPKEPHVWQIVRPATESSKQSWNEICDFLDQAYAS